MRLGWLILGLAACEEPGVDAIDGHSSRDRSGGDCFAEVVWDGDAWTVEITRDPDGRLLSVIYDHGGYIDVREVTWTADTASHRWWRERSDGTVFDEGEATERYVDGHIVARGDTETWTWSAAGLPESWWQRDVEGLERSYSGAWTLDGHPARAVWTGPGLDDGSDESWSWRGPWLVSHSRASAGSRSTLRWLEQDGLGRPTEGEVGYSTFEGTSTKPARWEWRRARAVSRDTGWEEATFQWRGTRLVGAERGGKRFSWAWEGDRVVARKGWKTETWTWDDDGWLVSATWDDGEAVYSGDCQRWSDDLAPRPAQAPAPREVPGAFDPQPPGLYERFDP